MNIKRAPSNRAKTAKSLWLRVATDLAAGLSISEVSERYINPLTGKPYSHSHIYWIIRQLKTRVI